MPVEANSWPADFATGVRNRRALLVLTALRGLTPRKLLELAHREGSAASCLASVRSGLAGSDADSDFARDADPNELHRALGSCGAEMVTCEDVGYPAYLEDLADPPAALFVRGRPLTETLLHVGVVGARGCSPLGREVATEIGLGLARAGVAVVSGAARGIDTASHEGALAAPGPTVAVLGAGIDIDYPKSNAKMLSRIVAQGTVVSEYPPGTPAEPFRFPARNRIIAGLSRAVVIVEGAERSGSLITAEHALDLGREVFAVPGAVNNPLATAPLAILRDGGSLVRGSEDLLKDLGLAEAAGAAMILRLSPAEKEAMDHLAGPTLPEAVARAVRLPVNEVVPLLLGLELKGLVRSVGGRYEQRHGASSRT